MNIQPFGEINPAELEEFYDGEIKVNGKLIEIDLNFEEESIEAEELTKVESFIKNIEQHMKQAFNAISADYDLGEESDTALFYLEHHRKELSKIIFSTIFGPNPVTKELFMQNLSANRIGLYPEEEEAFAIIDIQLPKEFTNYIMAVTFDNTGKFAFISMDS
ncbi:MAG: hypothetical protein COA78_04170 [Blastopirellula sp.]|nr:MAG: hypothetical protein COA78_04170 [Blastopirellula sp.]